MSAVDTIRKVLGTNLLIPEMVFVPDRGATQEEIREEEAALRRTFTPDHVALLRTWNGLKLDFIRLYGCGDATGSRIDRLATNQFGGDFGVDGGTAVGSDVSGFVFVQSPDGLMFTFDTDGGAIKLRAKTLDDFFDRLIFGPDAADFQGEDWLMELRQAGIL